jgi:hypothetical protein
LRSVRNVPIPEVANRNWPRNAVDYFILSKLEAAKITPSAEADRYTLIRRLSFDLLGLPPTPEEVAAFVHDRSPQAYEKLVDRLLASPRYGERWGRHWLDLARYADSNGADINYAHANAWRYRDYVIRSFNADKPYDEFVIEQLAGDLLDGAASQSEQHDRITATGFLMMGPKMLAEVDTDKLLIDIVDEQLDITGKTFLGMTFGCARCHDHKYDPITEKDYYALAGIFRSTKTIGKLRVVETKVSEWQERDLHSPELAAKLAKSQTAIARIENQIADLGNVPPHDSKAVVATNLPKLLSTTWSAWVRVPNDSRPNLDAVISATFLGADQGHSLGFHTGKTALHPRIVWNHGSSAHTIISSPDPITAGNWHHIAATYDAAARGLKLFVDGALAALADDVAGAAFTSINVGRREASQDWPFRGDVDDVTIFDRALPANVIQQLASDRHHDKGLVLHWDFNSAEDGVIRDVSGNGRQGRVVGFLDDEARWVDGHHGQGLSFTSQSSRAQALRTELARLKARATFPSVMAVSCELPLDIPVHIRGSHLDLDDQPVPRGTPEVFASVLSPTKIAPQANGRLELAQWITDPKHPLTARVMVNRIWQGHFGTGLVRTSSNFGLRGERPSHPDLLDWLAAEFIRSGRSVKHLHRLIVTSRTYRQTSNLQSVIQNPQSTDPENRLLWRQNIRRLEAEPIRDALLAAASQLDFTMGGSLLPTSNYKRVPLEPNDRVYDAPRRAVYLPVVRVRAYGMFAVFDFQPTGQHLAKRSATTVPQQALFMLNNPLVARQAAALAKQLASWDIDCDAKAVERLYLRLFARLVSLDERDAALAQLTILRDGFPADERSEGQVWSHFCHVLLASNEFIHIK